jgi:glycosyltransferase involved in cell wall biosynthesis
VRAAAGGIEPIHFAGAVPHHHMPAVLAGADIGVAPFDLAAHAPLSLGFYWSPLKIFEYMASGLPVVAPAVDRIPSLVANGREGMLYDLPPGGRSHAEALADTLVELSDAAVRAPLGAAARERAVRDYSWAAHCRALESAIIDAQGRRARR